MKKILPYISILSLLTAGCNKYLDYKQDKSKVIASSIQDAQALMDNTYNFFSFNNSEGTGMDDNFYLLDASYNTFDSLTKKAIVWDKGATFLNSEYQLAYNSILSCNTALETLQKISETGSNANSYNLAKGMALFFRGYIHHQLAIVLTLQFDPTNSSKQQGLVYKTNSDINEKSIRANLADTYKSILADLKESAQLLPTITTFPTRPNKAAAYGAIARVYLSMADYDNGLLYADSSLKAYSSLMDYNGYDISSLAPFQRFNPEVTLSMSSFLGSQEYFYNWNCDTALYNSYDSTDLRKGLYFALNGNGVQCYGFKGNYDESSPYDGPFNGIATDEVYLMRAECYARKLNTASAIFDLNTLLITRYQLNKFVPLTAPNPSTALDLVLKERRKELVWRCNLRWMDLKRLNVESKYAKTLTRVLNGQTFSLPPNDKRYAMLFPPSAIQLGGIDQNLR